MLLAENPGPPSLVAKFSRPEKPTTSCMLERQPRSVEDGIENALMPTAETGNSKKAGTASAVL
jgi:hypothetical protein